MLERMLAAVLNYLSDDEIEEIDLEYLLTNTKDLRQWWDQYREKNKKQVEEEIKKSLSKLTLEELESIREQIKEKNG
jgi:transposase-like protein